MSFNIDFAISATISQKTVEEMVKKVVEQKTGRKVKAINFKTASHDSDSLGRYVTYVCDGCTVEFENESGPKWYGDNDGAR